VISNPQYNVAAPGSLPVRVAGHMRWKMYHRFLEVTRIEPEHSLLDVGVTSDRSYESSNYLESWYPYKGRITAVGLDDAAFLEVLHPGLRFVRANGLALPFEDQTFDYVHSSAVLEHVGDCRNQRKFIDECCRVARRGVFLTTPNRWFPIEFHTLVPVMHWLPSRWFRTFLRWRGLHFYADERNLNLVTKTRLRALCNYSRATIDTTSLAGWPSNLLLHIDKT
jgi:ubiquinone/menaquinone biosynthesis C-methylase UbiE